jgi:hypothetical protein
VDAMRARVAKAPVRGSDNPLDGCRRGDVVDVEDTKMRHTRGRTEDVDGRRPVHFKSTPGRYPFSWAASHHAQRRRRAAPSAHGEQIRPDQTRPDPTTRVSLLQYCGGGLHIQQHPTSTVSSRAQTRTASAIRVVRQEHVRHPRGHGAAELGGRTKERATGRSHCVELEASYMDDVAGGEARRRCGRRGWSVEGCASPSASPSEVVRAVRPHSGVCQGEREWMWVRVRLQHHAATICEKGSGSREG